jgi:hypothetical protein
MLQMLLAGFAQPQKLKEAATKIGAHEDSSSPYAPTFVSASLHPTPPNLWNLD